MLWTLTAKWLPRSIGVSWRRILLRLFGAKISNKAMIYSSAKIYMPSNLIMDDYSCIASDVDCYNVALIHIEKFATVSQGAMLCTASHDIEEVEHKLITAPINIKERVWIGAKAFVGVASVWDKRKGLDEFVKLRHLLPDNYNIILVGLSQEQISTLPNGITGIRRTENVEQLVGLYSMADVFVNPTLEDNFPTTNLEAIACGTPVITYRTGGSTEAIDEQTGIIVDYQDVESLAKKTISVCETKPFSVDACRLRAEKLYDKTIVFKKYINLYNSLINR